MTISKGLFVAATALSGVSALHLPQVQLGAPEWPWKPSSSASSGNDLTGDLPVIDTKALQKLISADNLEAHAKSFYDIAKSGEAEYNHPTRVIGSLGHVGTLSYVTDELAKLGDYYSVSKQPFPAVSGNVFESRLVLGSEVPKDASPMGLTPPTANRQPVYGDLVVVANDGCDESDYPKNVTGNIALIQRGTCPFGTKSGNAGKAGAVAAIVYNTDDDEVHGTLGTPSPYHIATFGLSGKDGKAIVKRINGGEKIDSIAYIDAEVKTISTTNIIAQTRDGDPDNCVMLGGHSDSVAEGPGINDDGSGSISVLEIATQLTKFKVNNCVRFAWWAGEEEGLLGSDHYVEVLPKEENKKIRLFMDYDMMASPNFAYQIYNATNDESPAGSEELRNLYVDWYEDQGLNYTFIPFDGRSDYDGFIRGGIPAGGIATGAEGIKTKKEVEQFGGKAGDWYDPCYHQLCDDLSNLNYTAWVVNTKLIAHSVATYALSFDGFPKRTDDVSVSAYDEKVKYHGGKLMI
ncbi:Aminopeptidase Y [Neonectria ditissima]|uniref:Peptide hydrolase n=1 Tax=Neonectria ditissima TaxID=78410 RepID=A0A0P7BPX4_9HYPO|nr:Aminopeptidase Y [Neonectria ditissima]